MRILIVKTKHHLCPTRSLSHDKPHSRRQIHTKHIHTHAIRLHTRNHNINTHAYTPIHTQSAFVYEYYLPAGKSSWPWHMLQAGFTQNKHTRAHTHNTHAHTYTRHIHHILACGQIQLAVAYAALCGLNGFHRMTKIFNLCAHFLGFFFVRAYLLLIL